MQYHATRLITFLCAAGISCAALAQTSPSTTPASTYNPNSSSNPDMNQPSTSSSSSQSTSPSTSSPSTSTSSSTSSSTMTNSPRQVLARLDTSHKGYLSQPDVASNSYLSSHFAQCDTNGDGKLTEDELSTCLRNAPAGSLQ